MKAALSRELKKGKESRVVQVDEDRWKMAVEAEEAAAPRGAKKAAAKKATTKKAATKKTATKKTATKKAVTKKAATKTAEKPAARKKAASKAAPAEQEAAAPRRKKATPKAEPAAAEVADRVAAEPAAEAEKSERGRHTRRKVKKTRAETTAAPEAAVIEEVTVAEQEVSEAAHVRAPAAPPVPGTADEELAALYGDELSGTEPGAAFAEYRDAQTDDEDRPMMPEIVASRRDRQKRERRRRRRDRPGGERERTGGERERTGGERERGDRDRPRAAAPAEPAQAAQPERGAAPPRDHRAAREERRPAAVQLELPFQHAGNALGNGAYEILRSLRGDQPVRIKQLAEMMHKRELIAGDPEELWPHVKAALILDEQDRLSRGLMPRVVYRGRDQFAIGSGDGAPQELAEAADALAQSTHQAVKERLCRLDRAAFERVAFAYLMRQGWQGLEWIKRVQRTSYAVAEAPGGVGAVLVSVRAGDDPVDRRGVGELRVGIQAKNLASGLLLAPQDLSEIARQELRRPGPSISLLVGDALVAAFVEAGVGVRRTHLPVAYVDDAFFRDAAID